MPEYLYAKLDGPDLLRAIGRDARKWAEAFCEIKKTQGWSANDIDVDLMTTWFANALEATSQ